ncbi:MAG TPA: phosphoribosylanthranilate isomerase [Polyangiaceae bacterium]|jgi:phosphoribosylanthranilate isomerase|nr:phosphoribosylanthranilate isomerase [Polyangiaceae bacterium]
MKEPVYVKICGVTRVSDALFCLEAGASAIGLNFVATSKRRVDELVAKDIVGAVGSRLGIVAVVAGLSVDAMRRLRARTGIDWLQLHGDESPEDHSALLPSAIKAVRIGTAADAHDARRYGGERLLADAKRGGELGGTGEVFDWSLVQELARERAVILAGGLTPRNVAGAVHRVRPFGVDVATGVESAPGIKDPDLVRAFIEEARRASGE